MNQATPVEVSYKIIENIDSLLDEIPEESIVSRTAWKSDGVKAVLFGFDSGQSLSEHSAGQAAIVHMLEGEAEITLEDQIVDAKPGTWIYMPPRMVHSVTARTPTKMLLLLLK